MSHVLEENKINAQHFCKEVFPPVQIKQHSENNFKADDL